jgi:LacI family transcriptional regulator
VSTRGAGATLATIASVAGVSVSTVSKVVNGRPDVAPATRALVQDLLAEHEYVARRVESARAASIELMFHDPFTPYSAEVLLGVLDAAADVGVDVVVTKRPASTQHGGPVHSAQWIRSLASAGRQAVISVASDLTAADLTALTRVRVPIVVVDPINIPRARVVSVGSTNFAGGLAATHHLLDLGHRRIAYLGGPTTAACNQARMHGYRGAMETAGIRIAKGYVRSGQFRYEDGLVEGTALLALPQPPTAIFAGNDETALGVLEAARAHGLRVPEELSVVGFDDTESARVASPPLTTVAQPLQQMGAVALRTALRLAAGERVDSHHVELATGLVVRGSTAPPPTAHTATSRLASGRA